MAIIELRGKYAVGWRRCAQVDDEDYAELSKHKWKAKWNGAGNYCYAVSNAWIDGRHFTLRMHRVVLGLEPGSGGEVDHINHDTLDNRKENLRIVTRRENVLNRRPRTVVRPCRKCGVEFLASKQNGGLRTICDACLEKPVYQGKRQIILVKCANCGADCFGHYVTKRFCSDDCRHWSKSKSRPPSRQERLLRALSEPGQAIEIAGRSGVGVTHVRRYMADMVRKGVVLVLPKRKGSSGWSSSVYALAQKS